MKLKAKIEQISPPRESLWSGLQKRLTFTTPEENQADEQEALQEIEIGLTIQINES